MSVICKIFHNFIHSNNTIMKTIYSLLLLCIGFSCFSQIVNIPDVNFKNALLTYPTVIDTNSDGEIQESEAQAVSTLLVDNKNISSLAGIESFINLHRLHCNNNNLTDLNINSLTTLRYLDCSHNLLQTLHAEQINNSIRTFYCDYNNLTSLVVPNFFEFLDMGDQTMALSCSHNQLSSITFIDSQEDLSSLNLSFNNLSSFTFPSIRVYGGVILSDNPFTYLDLNNLSMGSFDPNDSYPALYINNTNLSQLIIPASIGSIYLYVNNNPNLISINLKNGKGDFFSYTIFDDTGDIEIGIGYYGLEISNNPQLALICCDSGEETYIGSLVTNVQVTPYCTLTPGGNYNTISGTVSMNCPSTSFINSNVKVTLNGYDTAGINGINEYVLYTDIGNRIVSLQMEHPSYFTVSPPNYTYNFTTTGNIETANFCITPNGVHPDLEVSIVPINDARPGFDAQYKLVYTNRGNQLQSGTLDFTFEDALLDFVSANPVCNSQTASTLSWNFTDLAPFEIREILVTLNVNAPTETPAVNNGDLLHYSAALTTTETDETPLDNQAIYNQIVVGSYDPNDKTCLEGNAIDISQIGDYLHYVIRFQNTGTAAAENVVISDYIRYPLNYHTLEIISSSHPVRSLLTNGNLEVFFENINLPSSNVDETASHGYIAFKIKLYTSYIVLNDIIENTANIYFDYNFPIVTNTVATEVAVLGTTSYSQSDFSMYPNPAKNILTIDFKNKDVVRTVTIYNTIGQMVQSFSNDFSQQSFSIDVSVLNRGTYFITAQSDNGKSTKKFIKL